MFPLLTHMHTHTHTYIHSANSHGQKAWSGLKYALNKWRENNLGVTEENKEGRGKKWTHKYNDEKVVQEREIKVMNKILMKT